jgi:hypothetical protein
VPAELGQAEVGHLEVERHDSPFEGVAVDGRDGNVLARSGRPESPPVKEGPRSPGAAPLGLRHHPRRNPTTVASLPPARDVADRTDARFIPVSGAPRGR